MTEQKQPLMKWEIKPSDIVSWALMIGGAVYMYATMVADMQTTKREVAANRTTLSRLEAKDAIVDTDLKNIRDIAFSRQEVIIGRLARQEAILERVEKALSK
jgi:uncharacterized transporter YbjL